MSKAVIRLRNINKYYGPACVIKNLSLDVYEGEFFTILGPSGCGKTTTLRMIAGFEQPTGGTILLDEVDVSNKEPNKRDVNTVFQSYALFPHMSVYNNVAYGLKMKKVPKTEIHDRVHAMLELVQLAGFEDRKPDALSGGQKQRVAIARALINEPKVLLLDEPLGALDLKLRKQMQLELKRLQRKLNITFVYVTHDQEEALSMSDRIAIMHEGVLEQVGSPREIYETPKTQFVATFIGETNLFEGRVVSIEETGTQVALEGGTVSIQALGYESARSISISVRPERMRISREPCEGFDLSGVVCDCVYAGSAIKLIVRLSNGQEVRVERLAGSDDVLNERVFLSWDPADARVVRSFDQAHVE